MQKEEIEIKRRPLTPNDSTQALSSPSSESDVVAMTPCHRGSRASVGVDTMLIRCCCKYKMSTWCRTWFGPMTMF